MTPVPRAARVALACVLAVPAWAASPTVADAAPEVRLGETVFVGRAGDRHVQVASFRGIPFAAPPVGDLRWRAPQPAVPSRGRQDATRFPAACFQDRYNADWYRKLGAAFGAHPDFFREPPFSEDCLYLNIWTPAPGKDARLPVMVWIHGGANRSGWPFEPNYDGEALAARGVVVVSIAYRVGVFGFFGHPELDGAANFGLLDQVAALRWVQSHVAAFGGDAGNVTVFGESAGAADIGYLILAPPARGLFHRAISQSGGYQLLERRGQAESEAWGLALASTLPGNPNLAGLRALDSGALLSAAHRLLGSGDFAPAVDGVVVTAPAGEGLYAQPASVDLLVGTNRDEWFMYVDDDPAALAAAIDALPEAARPSLRRLADAQATPRLGHDRAVTFANMACPAYLQARAAQRGGGRAYVYRFTRVRPGPGGRALGAYHGAEVPYVFDTHDAWLPSDAADRRLTETMMRYWTNFARSGDPNATGLPPWPGYDPVDAQAMVLGEEPAAQAAPDHALCLELASALYGAPP